MAIDYEALERQPRGVPRGEAHRNATITEDVVREIRRLHAEGYGYVRIGRAVGLSHAHVQRIVKRRAWAHVT